MDFEMVNFSCSCFWNREQLADGVTGVTCTYVGPMDGSSIDNDIQTITGTCIPPTTRISSVECYANGAINAFVRDTDEHTLGFVKVRPA